MNKSRLVEKGTLDRVSSTVVERKFDDTYYLNCRIYKSGNKNLTYRRGDDFLMEGRFKYTLSDNAIADVEKEIAKFDEKVRAILLGDVEYRVVNFYGTGITLYYRQNDNNLFDSLTLNAIIDETNIYHTKEEYIIQENVSARHILALSIDAAYWYREVHLYITKHNLHKHSLYLSALENKDDYMKNFLEVLYGSPDESALTSLKKIDGVQRLPRLTKAFDRTYTLLKDEVDEELLMNSGYVFLHRPSFAMEGNLSGRCELNPYTKRVVDAGSEEAELISFNEYLALFNDKYNWNRVD